jgi:regulator of replication initiation timing
MNKGNFYDCLKTKKINIGENNMIEINSFILKLGFYSEIANNHLIIKVEKENTKFIVLYFSIYENKIIYGFFDKNAILLKIVTNKSFLFVYLKSLEFKNLLIQIVKTDNILDSMIIELKEHNSDIMIENQRLYIEISLLKQKVKLLEQKIIQSETKKEDSDYEDSKSKRIHT